MKLKEGKFYFEYLRPDRDIVLVYIYRIITSLDNKEYAILYNSCLMYRDEIPIDIFNLSNDLGYKFTEMKSPECIINLVKTCKIPASEGDRFAEFYNIINKYKKTNEFKTILNKL